MTYRTPQALRTALERRLLTESEATGIALDRLRRRVIFERVLTRLHTAEPGRWVLKGGMALEVRLADRALAGKPFGRVKLDISPRAHELEVTDKAQLPNSLSFAGIDVPTIEIIDVQRHAAEKFHGMQRDFGDRDNSRVRDLVDLVILHENDLLDVARLTEAVQEVWREREGVQPPTTLAPYPQSWPDRYERLATDQELNARTFADAVAIVKRLWADVTTPTQT
jgi:hypothetical protein